MINKIFGLNMEEDMKKGNLYKTAVVMIICIFGFSLFNITYAVEFNDDIKKITLDYDYYDGIGNDKIIRSKDNGIWYLLKSDGRRIELKGNYIDYEGITSDEHNNYNDVYYRFSVKLDERMSRYGFVNKDVIECMVEGYSFADPTMSDKYWELMNVDADTNYQFGLYDKYNKKVVIPVLYNSFWYFNDDRIFVRNDEYGGMIDVNQDIIIPFEYYELQYINDSFIIAFGKNSKYGVINIDNDIVIPFEYNEIHIVSDSMNYLQMTKNNKSGLYDRNKGELVIPIEYESLKYIGERYLENELVVAKKDGKYGIIDMQNKEIVPFIYDRIEYVGGDGLKFYENGLAGLLDSKGNIILSAEAINILYAEDGFITAKVYVENYKSKYAVYDMKGNVVVPPIYDDIYFPFSDRYMVVKNNGYANLVDKASGEVVLNNSHYSDIWYISDKYFLGENNGYYSIVNFAGQELTDSHYIMADMVDVNGEKLLAAHWQGYKNRVSRIDYFKQTKGPSSWGVDEVSKAIESNLVPFEYQALFTSDIKRYEFCGMIVAFLEEYYNTSKADIIDYNKIDMVNPPISDEFNENVAVCLHLGIVNGRGNGIFDGEAEITREEAAVMLTNLAKFMGDKADTEKISLRDKSEISSWASDSVNFVLKNEFMNGTGNDMFSPKANITREQTYMIMYRIFSMHGVVK
ncbi:WG repeat-containing protein [Sedimentibacter sp.]|uniref:WG repeat-containing protein n=1 Tax=Sedimentibacter sp. TaxID=1960295 RepID=UPI00289D77FF|nr:WG repeat-containing protein [Sedimentibacter sp.]